MEQFELRKNELGKGSILILADTTDAGSDQASRRRQTQACLANHDAIFYLSQNCFMHQYHLMVRECLVETDLFLAAVKTQFPNVSGGFEKYCASLCKCVYFWRNNVGEFIDKFEAMSDKVSARTKVNLRRYPLAFINNRWGSIEATELFFLERGREILQAVFLAVLSRFMKASKEKVSSNAATDGTGGSGSSMPLMDNEEDAVHYQLKLSKWANGAFVAIQNSLFWLLLRVVNTARQPLSAFYFFMKKRCNDRLLFKLATGKGEFYMNEFRKLMTTHETWVSEAIIENSANDLPGEVLDAVRTFAFKLVMTAAGSFETRIMSNLRRTDVENMFIVCGQPLMF